MSFLQIQKAIAEVVNLSQDGEVNLDLANYWKYMMNECIESTEPAMTKAQLYALKPEVAVKITAFEASRPITSPSISSSSFFQAPYQLQQLLPHKLSC